MKKGRVNNPKGNNQYTLMGRRIKKKIKSFVKGGPVKTKVKGYRQMTQ